MAPSIGAIQRDAVSNAVETDEEMNARETETFGIDANRLNADLVAGTKRFLNHYGHAKNREQAVKHRKHYHVVEVSYLRDDGSVDKEERLVRSEKTRAQRIEERGTKDGERVKRTYNYLSNWLHKKVPRKTGGNYGSRKGAVPLVAPATTMPIEQLGVALASGRLVIGAVRSAVVNEVVGPLPSLSAAGDALALAGISGVVADAMESADLVLNLVSTKAQAKANFLHHREDALRFRRLLGKATPAEAEAYLAFDTAAARLIGPSAEEQATEAVIRDIAIKGLGIQPVSSGVSLAAQVAGYTTPVSAAAVSVVSGPLAVIAGGVDLHQARKEYLRRGAQAVAAWDRKQVMASVLREFGAQELGKKELEEQELGEQEFNKQASAGVLGGAMASLDGQQDRLIWQAKREKVFAKIRAARAGALVGGGVSGTVLAGVVIAGVVGASLVTPAGALLALPPLIGGAALAVRSVRQHRAEHTSKWRERAAAAAVQGMTRRELEDKLSKPAGDKAAQVMVSFEEGEYLAGKDRFAGKREITLDLRENEYVGLHIFALQIQDLVRDRDEKAAQPWIATLKGLGVDSVRLLAICKAASARSPSQQLDFIKSHLAPALGMNHRMTGPKALQHPSVFLKPFQKALVETGVWQKALPTTSDYRRVRQELVKQLGDEKEGMAAFKASISEFLRKTEKLPSSPLRSHLQTFLALDPSIASGTPLPEIESDQAVEFFRTPHRLHRA
ncbi:hypothetical protein [Variovorax guangxiensis]|uniref:hypothetical protein n=1 Tax=Variovorax guangxiensis TaxID=1775474 RepID=UPI002855C3FF|nr:hypothetical protein [Variovorax guangxiensis]MDR6854607.1 hypothetical protein [Variovorax guangxiensis]